jgi:hypothetical protein
MILKVGNKLAKKKVLNCLTTLKSVSYFKKMIPLKFSLNHFNSAFSLKIEIRYESLFVLSTLFLFHFFFNANYEFFLKNLLKCCSFTQILSYKIDN